MYQVSEKIRMADKLSRVGFLFMRMKRATFMNKRLQNSL